MVVNTKRLGRATVRTRSGTVLGKLSSLDFDADRGRLLALHVLPKGAVVGLLSDELVVTWQSIVSISEEEIVVQDGFVPYTAAQLAKLLPS